MRTSIVVVALWVTSMLGVSGDVHSLKQTPPRSLDTSGIEQAIGKAGQSSDGVYKVAFPRSDLEVSVAGVKIRPGFALGGWAAFMATTRAAVTHGDLVVTDDEVNPVISALLDHGVEITAVHNHLLHESPRVMYVHFWGQGDAVSLARALRAALEKTRTPLTDTSGGQSDAAPGFDAEKVQQIVGLKGIVKAGVLSMTKPRPEHISMRGVELPPSFGMATSMNVQGAGGGKVVATGDFVLVADEVNSVARALRTHSIEVTALHNHMLHGSPELYFMHFWADDAPERVAAGLRAALDAIGGKSPGVQR